MCAVLVLFCSLTANLISQLASYPTPLTCTCIHRVLSLSLLCSLTANIITHSLNLYMHSLWLCAILVLVSVHVCHLALSLNSKCHTPPLWPVHALSVCHSWPRLSACVSSCSVLCQIMSYPALFLSRVASARRLRPFLWDHPKNQTKAILKGRKRGMVLVRGSLTFK